MNRLVLSLLVLICILTTLGLFILYDSSSYTAQLDLKDKYYFIKNQSIWIALGMVAALFVSRLKESFLYNLSLPLLLTTLGFLVLVFLPGIGLELNGSRRWINLGISVFQPSELLKITLSLYLASWLSVKEKGRLPALLLLIGVACGLVLLQPDLKTSIIIGATSFIVYFVSGASIREIAPILLVGILGVVLVAGASPYRVQRMTAFQNVDVNNLDTTSYHTKQIVIALGSGGLSGVGFGNSVQKYAYLPEHTTDSIFAIFAEEAGYIGSVILVGLYMSLSAIGIMIAMNAKTQFGKLMATGITVFLTIQTLINLASQAILIPLTGVPLPFISYGGSSMLINFVAIGLLLNIALDKSVTPRKNSSLHRI
ncbi:MAG: putative peptidoglycan glycosyltransferase FtsW [Candidatus Levybacteria bacterium]|nr:putative peptidoglycan glycosyltransferase FtsW [Candidatus Levybacteria bacterium]